MANSFEESLANASIDKLTAGDTCPKECDKELFELTHPRNSQLDTTRHKDAPETEVVCIHHGIVEQR